MDPSNNNGGQKRLLALAQRLRLHKPPPFSEDMLEKIMEESKGKVVSRVGFPESATAIAQNQGEFRFKRAAVLICIFEGDAGELRVILTKRSSKLSMYSGEVALPGGKAEEGDNDDGDTAKREAMEEVGLDPQLVDVVTFLEPFFSKYLIIVVPVIGILHDKKAFKPAPNPAEVEAVFDVPLEMFLKDEKRKQEERIWMGEKYVIHLFEYEIEHKKYLIWGLTAGMLIRAASVVYQRPPAFLELNPIMIPRDEKGSYIAQHLEVHSSVLLSQIVLFSLREKFLQVLQGSRVEGTFEFCLLMHVVVGYNFDSIGESDS
ncbi:hypothetical protein HN873_070089 [Arachis hypogaea]